jgi:hypothetical protein
MPGAAKRIARAWAALEICAARRITAISCSSLKRRMSFDRGAHVADLVRGG